MEAAKALNTEMLNEWLRLRENKKPQEVEDEMVKSYFKVWCSVNEEFNKLMYEEEVRFYGLNGIKHSESYESYIKRAFYLELMFFDEIADLTK